jgi:hypothetical protein
MLQAWEIQEIRTKFRSENLKERDNLGDWIKMAQCRVKWRTVVNTVM